MFMFIQPTVLNSSFIIIYEKGKHLICTIKRLKLDNVIVAKKNWRKDLINVIMTDTFSLKEKFTQNENAVNILLTRMPKCSPTELQVAGDLF